MPDVSVIIPCFNDGATIGDTIASLRAQTVDTELIVVDDGSTDPTTLAVLATLAAGGATVIHQQNAGTGAARTTGLKAATAPYVLAVDADDQLRPGAIAVLKRTLDEHPELDLAWGDYEKFGDETGIVRADPDLDPWRVRYCTPCSPAALIRLSALLAVGGWKDDLVEDWELWLALAEHGSKGTRVSAVTVLYRLHGLRRDADNRADFKRAYLKMRGRHPALHARRRSHWLRSSSPLWERVSFPAIYALPLPVGMRVTACTALHHRVFKHELGRYLCRIVRHSQATS